MADFTYEQVMQALRNADAAGDVEAAQRLAKIAKEMGQPKPAATPSPETKPEEPVSKGRSLWEEAGRQLGLTARGAITGAAGIPLMLAEPVAAGINQLAGRQVFPSQYGALQRVLSDIGLPEPEGSVERAVQSGVSAMTGTGAQAALAQASQIPALAPLAREVPAQLAAAGAAGSAAQATSDRAEEAGFSPIQNFAASLVVGTLAGLAGAKGTKALTDPKTPQVTMDSIKQEATRAYNRVDQAGITVKPLPLLKTLDDIEANLPNFNPELPAHRDVKVVLDSMRRMVGTQKVSFNKLDQMRQRALQLARDSKEPATRRLAGQVVEGIDKKITSLQPNDLISGRASIQTALKDVKEARDAWRRMSKAKVLEDALDIAEARALAPTASEGELIRNQFKAIASSKDKMRLFNSKEQEAIRSIVGGSGSEKMLALLARFNPERSQLMTGVTLGAAMHSPTSAMIAATGAGAGYGAERALGAVQRNAANKVIAQILSGQVPEPRTPQAFRALVEAQARLDAPTQIPAEETAQ